jgi:hypothetical protein
MSVSPIVSFLTTRLTHLMMCCYYSRHYLLVYDSFPHELSAVPTLKKLAYLGF